MPQIYSDTPSTSTTTKTVYIGNINPFQTAHTNIQFDRCGLVTGVSYRNINYSAFPNIMVEPDNYTTVTVASVNENIVYIDVTNNTGGGTYTELTATLSYLE